MLEQRVRQSCFLHHALSMILRLRPHFLISYGKASMPHAHTCYPRRQPLVPVAAVSAPKTMLEPGTCPVTYLHAKPHCQDHAEMTHPGAKRLHQSSKGVSGSLRSIRDTHQPEGGTEGEGLAPFILLAHQQLQGGVLVPVSYAYVLKKLNV